VAKIQATVKVPESETGCVDAWIFDWMDAWMLSWIYRFVDRWMVGCKEN
jgi:hypothetical protein